MPASKEAKDTPAQAMRFKAPSVLANIPAGDILTRNTENALILQHEGLCRSVAARYSYCTSLPKEDLLQEARRGLLQSLRKYDGTKGGFGVFAYVTVRGYVLNAITRDRVEWPALIMESMDKPVFEGDEEQSTLHDRLSAKPPIDIELQLRLRRALWRLPPDQRHRMTALAHGTPQALDNLSKSRERNRQLRAVALSRLKRIFKQISALESMTTGAFIGTGRL